jgi:hypothetical protein
MPVETDQRPRHGTSAIASATELVPLLDWQAFCAAHFPGGRRHNLEAVVAYGAYRKSLERELAQIRTTESGRAEATALRGWEDEGGRFDRRPPTQTVS